LVVEFTKEFVTEHMNQTQIFKELNMVCETQLSKDEQMCEYLVNTTIPMIIEYLDEHDDPNQVCRYLGLC
jgi:hypothetical protein